MSSASDLAAELKRLEEELERKKMEEKIIALRSQLEGDQEDEYADETEYYEEEVIEEEEVEEEILEEEYSEEEYEEIIEDEVEEEPTYQSPEPVHQPPPQPTHQAPPASAIASKFGGQVKAPVSSTPAASVPAAPAPAPNGKVKRKLKLTGKPKYKVPAGTPAPAPAPVIRTPAPAPALVTRTPAPAPVTRTPAPPQQSAASAEKKGGVRRLFGLGGKNTTTATSPVRPKPASAPTPAPTPVAQRSQKSTSASSSDAPPAPQPFKARVIPKEPASAPGEEIPMELVLGKDLFAGGKLIRRSVKACTEGRDLTLLYFGSLWNRECKAFLPALRDFYCTVALSHNLEMVYVSHDRSLADFRETFAKMPWPAMPTGTSSIKNELSKTLKIIETPSLVVLETATGYCVTTHAVQDVLAIDANDFGQASALVTTWKSINAIPFDQVMMDVRLKHGKLERSPLYWQE